MRNSHPSDGEKNAPFTQAAPVADGRLDLYAPPRAVTDRGACHFYHTMDIPGHGHVEGEWDLRQRTREYLGGVRFQDKRVLEVGTASGFLCFHMESQGADVVAYDLSDQQSWDYVPFARSAHRVNLQDGRAHIRKLNNAWWLCHRALRSRARVVYGTVYDIPAAIGPVDIATFGSVLLHLRDPYLALVNALRLTRETVVITDLMPPSQVVDAPCLGPGLRNRLVRGFAGLLRVPVRTVLAPPAAMSFEPDYRTGEPAHTWWRLTPQLVIRFIGSLGFEETRVTYHEQLFLGKRLPLFTVVGRRTVGLAATASAA